MGPVGDGRCVLHHRIYLELHLKEVGDPHAGRTASVYVASYPAIVRATSRDIPFGVPLAGKLVGTDSIDAGSGISDLDYCRRPGDSKKPSHFNASFGFLHSPPDRLHIRNA
jgi:hypothetical protein